jgi:hypothetical protein
LWQLSCSRWADAGSRWQNPCRYLPWLPCCRPPSDRDCRHWLRLPYLRPPEHECWYSPHPAHGCSRRTYPSWLRQARGYLRLFHPARGWLRSVRDCWHSLRPVRDRLRRPALQAVAHCRQGAEPEMRGARWQPACSARRHAAPKREEPGQIPSSAPTQMQLR